MSYREDTQRAWDRVNKIPAHTLKTGFGTIQYATSGAGVPLLVSHGVLGSHAESIEGWWADLAEAEYRVVAPSRFGYFESTLPPDATPADQADAYALLLDHLRISRATVIAYSAGSASALEFALRYPDRVTGLILASCRLGGGVTTGHAFKPLFRIVYGTDRWLWLLKRLFPSALDHIMGAPKGYRPPPEIASAMVANRELIFPVRPRREGAIFDGFVSNMVADRFPFEELTVPTLVLSAKDDWLAPYPAAVAAASRMPNASLVTIEDGGHEFYGHDDELRREIRTFLDSLTARALEERSSNSTAGDASDPSRFAQPSRQPEVVS